MKQIPHDELIPGRIYYLFGFNNNSKLRFNNIVQNSEKENS